ncbi:MAG: hypothetical protein VW057_13590 [Rhodospirillaceae bacterium]
MLASLAQDMENLTHRFDFNSKLRDIAETQRGAARDTTVAVESAAFHAHQARLEPTAQTLSISRRAPHLILRLLHF